MLLGISYSKGLGPARYAKIAFLAQALQEAMVGLAESIRLD